MIPTLVDILVGVIGQLPGIWKVRAYAVRTVVHVKILWRKKSKDVLQEQRKL